MARNFNEKDNMNVLRVQPGKTQWDRFENEPPLKEPCWAFKNTGGGTKFGFKDHSDELGSEPRRDELRLRHRRPRPRWRP